MQYFSTLFGNELYMFQTDLLSIFIEYGISEWQNYIEYSIC